MINFNHIIYFYYKPNMSFFQIYFQALLLIIVLMTFLWMLSLKLKNSSIVDPFWGFGFVILGVFYYINTEGFEIRKNIILLLLVIWGSRLSIYLLWRNWGKGEDYRYQQFRNDFGIKRYWWISYFQVFLLQGILLWLISAPLLASQFFSVNQKLGFIDGFAILLWIIGFVFEAGGDFQLTKFKANPNNKGKLLTTGLWKYTRHPNYFGDATVWWAFGLFSVAVNCFIPLLSSILMTYLIVKISGVSLLERNLKNVKPNYQNYIQKTNAFFPWFPKK